MTEYICNEEQFLELLNLIQNLRYSNYILKKENKNLKERIAFLKGLIMQNPNHTNNKQQMQKRGTLRTPRHYSGNRI